MANRTSTMTMNDEMMIITSGGTYRSNPFQRSSGLGCPPFLLLLQPSVVLERLSQHRFVLLSKRVGFCGGLSGPLRLPVSPFTESQSLTESNENNKSQVFRSEEVPLIFAKVMSPHHMMMNDDAGGG